MDNDLIQSSEVRTTELARKTPAFGVAMAAQTKAPSLSIRDLIYVIFRHKKWVLTFVLGVLVLTLLAAIILPSKYRSEAKLLVRLGRESMTADPSARIGPAAVPMEGREKEINSEIQILKSAQIADRTIEMLGVSRILDNVKPATTRPIRSTDPRYIQAIQKFERGLSIDSVPDSNVLFLSYDAASPELAHDVVEAYIKAYIDQRAGMYRDGGSAAFFSKQVSEAKAKLDNIESQIRKMQDETGISNPETQRTILLGRIDILQKDYDTTRASLASAEGSIATIKQRLLEIPSHIETGGTTGSAMDAKDKLKATLAEERVKLKELRSRYTDNAPLVQIQNSKIAELEKLLVDMETDKGTQTTGINKTYEELNLRMEGEVATQKGLQARAESLQKQIEEARKGLAVINEMDIKIAELRRQSVLAQDNLRKYSEAQEQARIEQDLEAGKISNIRIAQAPTMPFKSVSPNRPMIMIFGFFFAVVGGVGLALLREGMDHTVHRPEDLAKLGVTRSVSVPYADGYSEMFSEVAALRPTNLLAQQIMDDGFANRARRAVRQVTGSTLSLFGLPGPMPEVAGIPNLTVARRDAIETSNSSGEVSTTSTKRHVAISDSLLAAGHAIIERLIPQKDMHGQRPQVIALVGSHLGEGSSTIAMHVAAAQSLRMESMGENDVDDRVLIIDANLRHAAIHKLAAQTRSPGLGTWVSQQSNDVAPLGGMIRPTAIVNLDILTAGSPKDAGQLPKRFAQVLSLVRGQYKHVFIDLPPLWEEESTARLAAMCDAVLLVAEAEKLRTEAAQQAMNRLSDHGAQVLGVVLNKRRYPVPDWIYRRS